LGKSNIALQVFWAIADCESKSGDLGLFAKSLEARTQILQGMRDVATDKRRAKGRIAEILE
jgi:hypothetical protein